mmetsp:Transcript_116504/g.226616  ORF Transcript_116504/g.226616 Transcript_116504/m.226616 type:complete len:83 (+) Transcript_116504:551-799(+)
MLVWPVVSEATPVPAPLKCQGMFRHYKVEESVAQRHAAFVFRQVQHVETVSLDWPFTKKPFFVVPCRDVSHHDCGGPRFHGT